MPQLRRQPPVADAAATGAAAGADAPWRCRPLSPDTWDGFAALVERHRGVWGGCWCLAFHGDGQAPGPHRREAKRQRVAEGRAHAALVFAGDTCVGWCQYGPPDELPRIKHLKVYRAGEADAPRPDWRITCCFTDRAWRGRGVSSAALAGALRLIAQAGGGRVESYPEDVQGRTVSASFLYNSRLAMFERQGFVRERRLGLHHWVVARQVVPLASDPAA